ncbi:hypothetical protein Tco_0686493 [Tanacetum coccineum]
MRWLSFPCSNSGSMRCGRSGLNIIPFKILGLVLYRRFMNRMEFVARNLLLMALPNEHQLTFDQYVDAQSMFAAIKARFGGNEATKKTQKALLKQQYENFNASKLQNHLIAIDNSFKAWLEMIGNSGVLLLQKI